jgi:RimJ/RimL family protein N-acetyltransferase
MKPAVTLRPLDHVLLDRLLHRALADASPDEVMPPPADGVPFDDAFRAFYGTWPAGTSMFVVLVGDEVAGMIRLSRHTSMAMLAETGMWLGRSFRSQGYGRSALRALLDEAAAVGVEEIVADTRPDNVAALAVLRACGATLREDAGKVYASLPVTA